ncbi:MAG: DUF882 domain-containing protein [Oscillospiraceae bacterium]|nr:DUF882 domain-containing protein [Oscillospiraceae bacterium]
MQTLENSNAPVIDLAIFSQNPISIFQTLEASAASYTTGQYKINTKSGCNVRKEAGTKSVVLGAATNGTSFTVSKVSGSWGYGAVKCTNGTKTGWVCLDYCSKTSPSPSNNSSNSNNKPASKVVKYSKSKDGNKYLSKNFKVKEFACKDGSDTIYVDNQLVWYLQQIRDHYGKAVVINSAYRTSSYNKKVGGATNSYHVKGMAADIRISGVAPKTLAAYAKSIGIKGAGTYSSFVHVDTRTYQSYWNG